MYKNWFGINDLQWSMIHKTKPIQIFIDVDPGWDHEKTTRNTV